MTKRKPAGTRTVYKYDLKPGLQTIELPAGAQVLSAGVTSSDEEEAYLWAMVDPDAPKVSRRFVAAGTGHPLPGGELRHIESFRMYSEVLGVLVFHVFEVL